MATVADIVLLPGDGVGPEVVAEAKKVLEAVSQVRSQALNLSFNFKEELLGGCAIDATGSPFPEQTKKSCQAAAAILLGAVGGPQWPRPATAECPKPPRPEQGLLDIRKELDLFANIRPCRFPSKSLVQLSPLKEHLVKGTDFIVVRELTGGIYFGKREEETNGQAYDTMSYSVEEVQRITRIAGELAMLTSPPQPIMSIDKANVLATSRLWRRVATETIEKEFPRVKLSHNLVDSAAMHMINTPRKLNGVVLTENMFGDILSDEASVIPGSLGLLPSASLNGWGSKSVGLYEPIHGSAPDIAGQGIANPIGTILSAAMLLRYSLGLEAEAKAVEDAVEKVLDNQEDGGLGLRTRDLGGSATTSQIGDAVISILIPLLQNL
ncbi:3-isopropylmalate dehydrogenase [Polychytrium aggregatum]|uniref:3-isopropylmalate dehydrogenase n=1 Tax=Polychytrium aggregatum TaxID=110093 RepID=UPI0022FECA37|nr:3-isopropylmalate dehydrogenase [Polychytrium aggregatum]KAI9206150.1 3-isopropylmalate dehydrogenase [Polychytrium aggregatum]